MLPSLNRLILYVKDVQATCAFYSRHFGFVAAHDPDDRIIELTPTAGGVVLMLHQAAKSVKIGQVTVKLVFDTEDIDGFKAHCLSQGLAFSPTHHANGYSFANAKDPDGNSISISSRAFVGKSASSEAVK